MILGREKTAKISFLNVSKKALFCKPVKNLTFQVPNKPVFQLEHEDELCRKTVLALLQKKKIPESGQITLNAIVSSAFKPRMKFRGKSVLCMLQKNIRRKKAFRPIASESARMYSALSTILLQPRELALIIRANIGHGAEKTVEALSERYEIPSDVAKTVLCWNLQVFRTREELESAATRKREEMQQKLQDETDILRHQNLLLNESFQVEKDGVVQTEFRALSKEEAEIAARKFIRLLNLTDAADKPASSLDGCSRFRLELCLLLAEEPGVIVADKAKFAADVDLAEDWEQVFSETGCTLLLI